MKITEIINGDKKSLSFEVFPPKKSDKYESVLGAVKEIASLSPSYMSVTYGAGGGTSEYTAKIAREVRECGITSLAHLSCISSNKKEVKEQLTKLSSLGIENILALRGDIPSGFDRSHLDFHYAYELIDEIKKHGDFCIGGACYPECHPESESREKDIEYLKMKVEHGCSFLTTQMFFDNGVFFDFSEKLYKAGIFVPVVPGIMPITSVSQIERTVAMSGSFLPDKFLKTVEKYQHDPVSFKSAGIEYATEQAFELYSQGVGAVHIYSMNKYDVAKQIKDNLREVIR
ncbi:MAG: methylenetetrahydrofolate reductase [NAD(P)H] [Eubacteriales bacterium]